jgi:hypothetical protein
MKKAKAGRPKVAVRPRSTGTNLMGFRANARMRAGIMRWAEQEPDQPTPSEAIRRLVKLGLTVRTRQRSTSRVRSDQADVMAADQLDRLADHGASAEEQAIRKRHLLEGPEEFRQTRIDRPKRI